MGDAVEGKEDQREARRKIDLERRRAVIDRYFIDQGEKTPLKRLRDLLASLEPAVRKVAGAFEHNVSGAEMTMGMPGTFAAAAAQMKMWTQVLGSERIRALMDEDSGSPESEVRTIQRAKEHMARHVAEGGETVFVEDMCEFLLGIYEEAKIPRALSELHAQGVVLLWSAVEVLGRDLFIVCLNTRADLANRLFEDEGSKRLFQLKALDFSVLQQHRFNVSRSMGDILAQTHDLSRLTTLKACFSALFPQDEELRKRMSEADLWKLFQRRNLIVHRRGLVDERYVEATGESLPIGTQLSVRSSDLERAFEVVCSVGERLIVAANDALKANASQNGGVEDL
jgi:hypothetical protein